MAKVDVLEEFEGAALEGVKAVRAFMAYQGDNKRYLNRAKIGSMVMSAYSRLRATINNEQAMRQRKDWTT